MLSVIKQIGNDREKLSIPLLQSFRGSGTHRTTSRPKTRRESRKES
jgi:hypothetical protein